MGYWSKYGISANAWHIGQYRGFLGMYGKLGMYGILGNIWYFRRYMGFWGLHGIMTTWTQLILAAVAPLLEKTVMKVALRGFYHDIF